MNLLESDDQKIVEIFMPFGEGLMLALGTGVVVHLLN